MRLTRLMPAHLRGFYKDKLDGGLSGAAVQKIHVVLHKALKQMVMDGVIRRNATEAVKPPRPAKREMRPLNPEETRRLLEAAHGDRFEPSKCWP